MARIRYFKNNEGMVTKNIQGMGGHTSFFSSIPFTIRIYFMQLALPPITNLTPSFTSTSNYRAASCHCSYLTLQNYLLQEM